MERPTLGSMPHEAPPIDGISGAEAAEILGIQELSVSRLVMQGVLRKAVRGQKFGLDRADVERVALERYRPGHPYWCTSGAAAEILGVSVTRVHQLVDRGAGTGRGGACRVPRPRPTETGDRKPEPGGS